MSVPFAADSSDVTAPGFEWCRGGQVASSPGRGNGSKLRNRADHRALGAGRREPRVVPSGAAEGGPHAAYQARQ